MLRRQRSRRNPLVGLILALACATPNLAWTADSAPEDLGLPIGLTPGEVEAYRQLIESGVGTRAVTQPPTAPIRQCAEWEPVTGCLVRYPFGLSNTLLKEIAEDIELWIYVASTSQQTTCSNSLQSAGVNMANVHFIITATNSIWTRDYGPQFVFDGNGDQGIIDHTYNRPRPSDDQTNWVAGPAWGVPVYGTPLIHTGGNYACDGHGNGYSTNLVYNENTTLTQAQVDGYMQSYLGVDSYRVVPDISIGGIHHLDVWAKLLDERRILVKQLPAGHPDFARVEADVAAYQAMTTCYGEPLEVVRIFCPTLSGTDVAGYTNSIILNNKVLVPTFGISGDAAALQTYQQLMPGYEIVGFSGSWVPDDAIHCRNMGIHDKFMLYVDLAPLPDTLETTDAVEVLAEVDDRSEAGLKAGWPKLFWRLAGDVPWNQIGMTSTAGPDSFAASIPGQLIGTTVEYYVQAEDNTNRRWQRPPVAPADSYRYYVGATSAGLVEAGLDGARVGLVIDTSNPFRDQVGLTYRLPLEGQVEVCIFDVAGREIRRLEGATRAAGLHRLSWDGKDARGAEVADGVYLVRVDTPSGVATRRLVRLR